MPETQRERESSLVYHTLPHSKQSRLVPSNPKVSSPCNKQYRKKNISSKKWKEKRNRKTVWNVAQWGTQQQRIFFIIAEFFCSSSSWYRDLYRLLQKVNGGILLPVDYSDFLVSEELYTSSCVDDRRTPTGAENKKGKQYLTSPDPKLHYYRGYTQDRNL